MAYHTIIYADILLALNFFLNFFLLWATGRFLRLQTSLWRLLLAAAVGAGYAVGILLPRLAAFYAWPVSIAFSLIILCLAFPYRGIWQLLRLTATFYLIAFAMAGAVLAGSSLLVQQGYALGAAQTIRGGALLFGIILACIVARRGAALVRRKWRQENFILQLEVVVAGRSLRIPTLIDTGNDLVEPISGKPVIVAHYQSLQTLLPHGLRLLWQQYQNHDPTQLLQAAAEGGLALSWERRLRLIPYASIGKNHGLLLGFLPDYVVIHGENKLVTKEVIIALHQDSIGKDDYKAVLNPAVLVYAEEEKAASA